MYLGSKKKLQIQKFILNQLKITPYGVGYVIFTALDLKKLRCMNSQVNAYLFLLNHIKEIKI
jgi:hypothetical protein